MSAFVIIEGADGDAPNLFGPFKNEDKAHTWAQNYLDKAAFDLEWGSSEPDGDAWSIVSPEDDNQITAYIVKASFPRIP